MKYPGMLAVVAVFCFSLGMAVPAQAEDGVSLPVPSEEVTGADFHPLEDVEGDGTGTAEGEMAEEPAAPATVITLEIREDPKTISEKYAHNLFELGRVHYQSQNYKAAIAYLLEAERVAADKTEQGGSALFGLFTEELWKNKKNYYFLGLAYRDAGKYEEAVTAFEKVTTLDEKDYESYLLLGQANILTGKNTNGTDGSQACKKAAELKPDLMEAYLCVAEASMMNNGRMQAVKFLEKAIETDPSYVPAYEALIKIHEESSKPEKADPVREQLKKLQQQQEGDNGEESE